MKVLSVSLLLLLTGGGMIGTVPLHAQETPSHLLWTQTSQENQPPSITSTPPPMVDHRYEYHVEAVDPDNDVLTFSLNAAPHGMSIGAQSGLITWKAATGQIGSHSVDVRVTDSHGGDVSQSFVLDVTDAMFPNITAPFLAGINLEENVVEHDATVLSISPGDMENITRILLPDVPDLLTFSNDVHFYFGYTNGIEFIPEVSMVQMAVIDAAKGGSIYDDIDGDDLDALSWETPAAQVVTAEMTVVFQNMDGEYTKVGLFELMQTHWAVRCFYERLP